MSELAKAIDPALYDLIIITKPQGTLIIKKEHYARPRSSTAERQEPEFAAQQQTGR